MFRDLTGLRTAAATIEKTAHCNKVLKPCWILDSDACQIQRPTSTHCVNRRGILISSIQADLSIRNAVSVAENMNMTTGLFIVHSVCRIET